MTPLTCYCVFITYLSNDPAYFSFVSESKGCSMKNKEHCQGNFFGYKIRLCTLHFLLQLHHPDSQCYLQNGWEERAGEERSGRLTKLMTTCCWVPPTTPRAQERNTAFVGSPSTVLSFPQIPETQRPLGHVGFPPM